MIHTSETYCWRRWDDMLFEPGLSQVGYCSSLRSDTNGVYWNEGVYWVSDMSLSYALHRFDIEQEKILGTSLPRGNFQASALKHLGESWNRLYLISYVDADGRELNIYEMERDCFKWCLKYHLNNFGQDLQARFDGPYVRSFEILVPPFGLTTKHGIYDGCTGTTNDKRVFFPAEEEEEAFLIIRTLHGTIWYNFGGGTVVNICCHRTNGSLHAAHPYIESLSSFC